MADAEKPQQPADLQDSCNLQIPPKCGNCEHIGLAPGADYCMHAMTKYMRVQWAGEPPSGCPIRSGH